MGNKFNFKQAIIGGLAGLSAPYLTIILAVGIVMWDWNLLLNEVIREPFMARLSTIMCILGFFFGGIIDGE